MATVLDKETVEEALRELIHEEPATFKTLLREIFIEEKPGNDGEFDQFLKDNLEKYGDTFRALA